jgi:purine-binding chemotaxis protein CheW
MDLVEIRKKAKKRMKKTEEAVKKKAAPRKAAAKKTAAKKASPDKAAGKKSARKAAPAEPSRETAPVTPEPAAPAAEEKPQPPAEPAAAPAQEKEEKAMKDEMVDSLDSLKDVLQSQHGEKREEEEEEQLQLLTFMLGGEEYALNIMDIKEIIRPKEATEVPKAPEYIMGIISLRGTIIPIFDVNRRLGLSSSERSAQNRVVVVKSQEHFFGLLVDSVVQVMDLPISRIEPPPEILGGVEGEFLRGVGRIDERLVILLNLSRILSMDDSHSGAELELPAGESK